MLTLLLRVQGQSGHFRDISVQVEDEHTVADLAQALSMHMGDRLPVGHIPQVFCERLGVLSKEATVSDIGLISGDEVVLSLTLTSETGPKSTSSGGLVLEVIGGPRTGTSLQLRAGSIRIGRSEGMEVGLEDPTVSSHHATLFVDSSARVEIEPAPTLTNPLVIDGENIQGRVRLSLGSVIQLGSSAFTVRIIRNEGTPVRDQLGQIPFNRTPYRRPEVGEPKVTGPGRLPSRFEPRPFQIIAMAMPAMSGLVMWATMPSGGSRYLLLALLSPIMGLATWWDDRRRGGKKHQTELEEFEVRRRQWIQRYDLAIEQEREIRNAAAPDLASIVRRAKVRSTDLWQRNLMASDFLTVRVGLGDSQTTTSTEIPNGDDGPLLNKLEDEAQLREVLVGVPITLSLTTHGVVAVHGPSQSVESVASAIALQIAGLHSPEDAIVVSALHSDRTLNSWMKWLPHTRSVSSPLTGEHVVVGREATEDLIRRLLEIESIQNENARTRVVLFLDERCQADKVLVSSLLSSAASMKFSVIWLGDTLSMVPRQASAIVECPVLKSGERGHLWFTDPAISNCRLDLDQMSETNALDFARSLAPVTDTTSASATASIPRMAPLFATLGVLEASPEWISGNWLTNTSYGLSAPVGIGASGQFSIDLVQNGPHGLIAGTSGAGKSELLQSLVASLASQYPPERLNFLFIDYKGGASSNMFKDIPHTVGYVTNLSPTLSMRALTSLRAELNRRMRMLEGRAKDLEEMLELYPQDCPPSLVIVVDEFATLVKEIPDFVTGMVDIAQRGRSLGIHLILATQRPTGSVNDNILANTNLRISLRVLDSGDSQSIIGTSDAAFLPAPLKGRAFARTGAGQLMEFQSAFAGAPFTTANGISSIAVEDFPTTRHITQWPEPLEDQNKDKTSNQLTILLDAITSASSSMGKKTGRAPWIEPLPNVITLEEIYSSDFGAVPALVAGRDLLIGVEDDPDTQSQYPFTVNLESQGGLAVIGNGGSGKTTAIRTIVANLINGNSTDDVVVYILDFAGRTLENLRQLPHVAAVASSDLEEVTRVIQLLSMEVRSRQEIFASFGSENMTVYSETAGTTALPRITLVIDGLGTFLRVFDRPDLYAWVEVLFEVMQGGRSVGIHTIVTMDQRRAIPPSLSTMFDARLVLRAAENSEYIDAGMSTREAQNIELEPGQAIAPNLHQIQIAVVSSDHSSAGQVAALVKLAGKFPVAPVRLRALPDSINSSDVRQQTATNSDEVAVGLEDLTLGVATISLRNSNLLIAGSPESGRTTVAHMISDQLVEQGRELFIITDPGVSLTQIKSSHVAVTRSDHQDLIAQLKEKSSHATIPPVLLIDSQAGLDDSAGYELEDLMKSFKVRVIAVMSLDSASGYASGWLGEAKKSRNKIILQPEEESNIVDVTGIRMRWRPTLKFPQGRGVLMVGRRQAIVQFSKVL